MPSRLSINLKVHKVDDWGKTREYLRQLDPVEVVACIDNMNDRNRIFEIKNDLPKAKIHARFIIQVDDGNGGKKELDGAMHTKPQNGEQWLVSPDSFLNSFGELGMNGLSLYTLNEPSGEVDRDTITRLVRWTRECIKLANERGIALSVINFGVGHPLLINNETEWDARFDDVLEDLSVHRQHTLGAHLYAPADTHKRLDAMIARCKKIKGGIKPPRVAITEAGWDTHNGDRRNGYKSRGMTGEEYANWQTDLLRDVYAPYIRDGIVTSICTFIWGDKASWEAFNVENDAGWRDTILKAKREGKLDIEAKATTPTVPSYQPYNFTPGAKYTMQSEGGAETNLRKATIVDNTNKVGQPLKDKTEVILLELSKVSIDYWYKLQVVADKREGWVSGRGGALTFTPVPSAPTEPTTPETPYPEIIVPGNGVPLPVITIFNPAQMATMVAWRDKLRAERDDASAKLALVEHMLKLQADAVVIVTDKLTAPEMKRIRLANLATAQPKAEKVEDEVTP